jgi:hypothetical protein
MYSILSFEHLNPKRIGHLMGAKYFDLYIFVLILLFNGVALLNEQANVSIDLVVLKIIKNNLIKSIIANIAKQRVQKYFQFFLYSFHIK